MRVPGSGWLLKYWQAEGWGAVRDFSAGRGQIGRLLCSCSQWCQVVEVLSASLQGSEAACQLAHADVHFSRNSHTHPSRQQSLQGPVL